MINIQSLKNELLRLRHNDSREVALTLSSGGARGMVHVGAIEALTERGYHIHAISGCSFGAIVAAAYAAGGLEAFKKWMAGMDRRRMFELSDFHFGLSHIMKGDRLVHELERIIPDRPIEELPIPFSVVATDWKTGREVVFSKGSMWTAVRASISIPAFYKPLILDKMILIDGGITNPLPLNRVARKEGDLLVGINVSGHDYAGLYRRRLLAKMRQRESSVAMNLLSRLMPRDSEMGLNFYSIINQALSISINANAHRAIELYKPDILVDLPMRRYGGNDYDKAQAITKVGHMHTLRAIDGWEKKLGK